MIFVSVLWFVLLLLLILLFDHVVQHLNLGNAFELSKQTFETVTA